AQRSPTGGRGIRGERGPGAGARSGEACGDRPGCSRARPVRRPPRCRARWGGGPMSRRHAPEGPVVVVGGGIAGLATAALLAHEGRDVTLVEATDSVGGRAGSWSARGFRFDTGPSWYLMPEVFDHFFRLCGTSADEQLDLVR